MDQRTKVRRHGFTLAELVLSLGIMTILLGGTASVILIASHALPDKQDKLNVILEGGSAVDRIAGDLHCALSFTERTATAVTFTAPDRDGDAAPETVRYAWSGVPGDPLTRQYNGGAAVNIVETTNQFELEYDYKWVPSQNPPTMNESVETLLFVHDPTADLFDFAIDSGKWPGQYFEPVLPADAVSWKVTRVKFKAQRAGSTDSGVVKVQLRSATNDKLPEATVLEEYAMYETDLTGSYLWQEFAFSSVSGIPFYDGLCLVLEHASGNRSADIQYRKKKAGLPNGAFLDTDNGGLPWRSNSDAGLLLYVYGTVTTTGEPAVPKLYHLTGVRITLRTGGGASTPLVAGVQVLNAPEVAGL